MVWVKGARSLPQGLSHGKGASRSPRVRERVTVSPPVKCLASSCLGFFQDNRKVNGRSGLETQTGVTTILPIFPVSYLSKTLSQDPPFDGNIPPNRARVDMAACHRRDEELEEHLSPKPSACEE